jgi:hypothetical protein
MRKSSKIALAAVIVGIVLFAGDLPFGSKGWEKTTGSILFVLSVLAVAVAVIAGGYSLATRTRTRAVAK